MKISPTFALTMLASSLFIAPHAKADYVYAMHIERGNSRIIEALATKVNDTQFVTDAELVSGADKIFLLDSSVTPVAKVLATVSFVDKQNRLAVLTASSVNGKAVTIALNPQGPTRQISLLLGGSQSDSVVQRYEPKKDLAVGPLYVHTMRYTDKQWAAPLVNNCGELLGISVYESGVFSRMNLPEIFAYATGTAQLKSVLDAGKVSYTVATDVCLSDIELAEKNAEEARKKVEEAQKELEQADKEAQEKLEAAKKEAEAELEKQRLELEKAKTEADDVAKKTAEELEKARLELEQLEKDREKVNEDIERLEQEKKSAEEAKQLGDQQKIYLAAGAAAVFLIGLIIFLMVLRKRRAAIAEREQQLQQKQREASGLEHEKQQLSAELQQLHRTFNDILLDGVASDGRTARIKISGKALAQQGVQVIGRESTQVDYALAEAEISRKHVQIILRDNRVYVEDLKSQNGSWVNNQALIPHQPVELTQGAQLKLSSFTFTVTFL
ncbi:FHA domain-containing protein [Pseudidiomarina mangrovi]|uniref:FHA domain-containing protein n=1 Tax=Pseudidiomarina mangrovi TaxID=2487133 RepID=UPI000FCCC123|nr:FHA domain-containing protein [Pseudidiomarina mangrovi]CAI8167734.1 MAG: Chromosome partition protein Smc [Pseudidiomarina mangrovi]